MISLRRALLLSAAAALTAVSGPWCGSSLLAEELVFTIDPQLSSIGLVSEWPGVTVLEPQGPGGDITAYSGTITVDVDDRLAPTSIEFLGSWAVAADSGDWLPQRGGGVLGDPGAAEPANYGVLADAGLLGTAYAALRDVVFGVTSLPTAVTAGEFGSGQVLTVLAGLFEGNVPAALGGDVFSDPFEGDTLNMTTDLGSYTVDGNVATLVLPILFFTGGSVETTWTGEFVATVALGSAVTGDFNTDGAWNCEDINALTAAIASGSTDLAFDMNGDGTISLADINEEGTGWLAVAGSNNPAATGGAAFLMGDANLDGSVDVSDFNLWNGNKFTSVAAWCLGDFNADGSVDVSDFNNWNGNKFLSSSGSPAAIPEPQSWLLALGLLAGLPRARRRADAVGIDAGQLQGTAVE